MNFHLVVTSINPPNRILKEIASGAMRNKFVFILIGDVKSPCDFHLEGCDYYDIERQEKLDLLLPKICPKRHYARKNIGYLVAIANSSGIIIETDDDNIPLPDFWNSRSEQVKALHISHAGWLNIYSYYCRKNIWARGFPLESIKNAAPELPRTEQLLHCPIQQGLADANPDVDAVYRMVGELPVSFEKGRMIALGERAWHPFNSQNTTWFKEAFPLMYLPAYCSFRMTDIWRSFVAQRIAWTCNWNILYHQPTVYQERNDHNLLKDFEDEVPGYLWNAKIVESLDTLHLKNGASNIPENMLACYEELVRKEFIKDHREIDLLKSWLDDLRTLRQ